LWTGPTFGIFRAVLARCLNIFAAALLAAGQAAAGAEAHAPLKITIQPGGWGQAPTQDIRAVTRSAAGEIWRHCPNVRLDPICIRHAEGSPITHFKRDTNGAIVVGLATRDLYWAQYAYQFAHEFGHALAVHAGEPERKWLNIDQANQWFEESLCETASLFALRAMARSWATNPPYPNWKSFAPKLRDYADKVLADPARQLPAGQTFQSWFAAQEPSLRTNATQRAKNGVVAAQLLPLFEQAPRRWSTLLWLNLGTRERRVPFRRYLAEWKKACPVEDRPFIDRMATLFGCPLSGE
jgi:hypothetical protein